MSLTTSSDGVTYIRRSYPCLMCLAEHPGCIVLFTEERVGTCIQEGTSFNRLGQWHDKWMMSAFIPFTGSVTLTQD